MLELKSLACRNRSLPLSVKILHLDVCMFDTTEPSSILVKPPKSVSVDESSAMAGVEFNPRNRAAKTISRFNFNTMRN